MVDKEYITFQFAELTNNGEFNVIDGYSILYKIFNSNLRMVLYTTPNNIEFHFLDRYIIRESKKGIIVYDTKKYIKGNYYFLRKEKEYKRIDRIHLRQVIKDIRKFHDSYIEFDKEKKKAIMHLRLKKDQPMQKRVYKFKDGKFILVEDE